MADDDLTPTAEAADETPFERLRELLLEPERAALESVSRRVEITEKTRIVDAATVSRVLPQAVSLRHDGRLGEALAPTVEQALHESVRREPEVLAKAIAPVLAPAIRKAINDAIAGVVQRVEAIGNAAFSVQGLKWRLQAWRTGQSYGEVALSHSLVYQVRELYLIHRETGLLLVHVHQPDAEARDPDTLSAMLTAIADFGVDSFGEEATGLQGFQYGDLRVLVEEGPKAVLAATVRGHPPVSLREPLRHLVALAHDELPVELERFGADGDVTPFDTLRGSLEHGLLEARMPRKRNRVAPVIATLAIVLLLFWIGVRWWEARERRRGFRELVESLEREPGLVVTRVDEDGDPRRIVGLRDPFARDPEALRAEAGDVGAVTMSWRRFRAARPEWIARRLREAVPEPPGVRVEVREDRVVVAGVATRSWFETARRVALALGATELVPPASPLLEQEPPWLETLARTRGVSKLPANGRIDADVMTGITALRDTVEATDAALPPVLRQTVVLTAGTGAEAAAARLKTLLETRRLQRTEFETRGGDVADGKIGVSARVEPLP